MFKVITPVAVEPVTVAEAKLHLRVDNSDEDALIGALITAAREYGEHYTGCALAPATLEMSLDEFPADLIELDMPPVASITSIKYTDASGVEQTLDPSKYAFSAYGQARNVSLTYGNSWPVTRAIPDAVRIRYVTGYTTTPKAARAAILLTIGHLYENRESVGTNTAMELPLGARSLFDTVKVWSL